MSDLLNKIKNFFIKPKVSSNDVDNLQFNILSNGIVESPPVSFQLIFKVYKDKLDSSIVKAKSLRLNLNSMYLDDYYLGVSREKEFVPVDNPCGADLPQITGYYFWDKKYVSTGVYFNAALLNDVDFQSANPVIEVYDFTEGGFSILPFEYCSTEVPNPTKYDFLVDIKSATTLLNPIESEEDVDYYLYTADLEGKIYLSPLVEITGDSYTLQQLNEILGKGSSNTMFSRGELASITSLKYKDIPNLSLDLSNFKYFINLDSLTIENCTYTNIPDEICNLPNLKQLNLSSNQITALPDCLSNLFNLQKLFLGNNNIATLPSSLANLNNLQEVHIEYNSISNISIFKDKNISIYANNQFISKTNITLSPSYRYEINIEYLRDFDDKVPTITEVNLDHITIPKDMKKEIINNEQYIILDSTYIGRHLYIVFNSSSNSSIFSGEASMILT